MKGLVNGKKGFLLSYREVTDKLSIPKEYFLNDLSYYGEEVIIKLIKKDSFSMDDGGAINIDPAKEQERRVFIKKEELERKLGITVKNPNFIMCFWDRGRLTWRYSMDHLFAAREMLGKENFFWITNKDLWDDHHRIEFMEMDW